MRCYGNAEMPWILCAGTKGEAARACGSVACITKRGHLPAIKVDVACVCTSHIARSIYFDMMLKLELTQLLSREAAGCRGSEWT